MSINKDLQFFRLNQRRQMSQLDIKTPSDLHASEYRGVTIMTNHRPNPSSSSLYNSNITEELVVNNWNWNYFPSSHLTDENVNANHNPPLLPDSLIVNVHNHNPSPL